MAAGRRELEGETRGRGGRVELSWRTNGSLRLAVRSPAKARRGVSGKSAAGQSRAPAFDERRTQDRPPLRRPKSRAIFPSPILTTPSILPVTRAEIIDAAKSGNLLGDGVRVRPAKRDPAVRRSANQSHRPCDGDERPPHARRSSPRSTSSARSTRRRNRPRSVSRPPPGLPVKRRCGRIEKTRSAGKLRRRPRRSLAKRNARGRCEHRRETDIIFLGRGVSGSTAPPAQRRAAPRGARTAGHAHSRRRREPNWACPSRHSAGWPSTPTSRHARTTSSSRCRSVPAE